MLGERHDHHDRDRDRPTRPILHAPHQPTPWMVEVAILAVARRQHVDAGAQFDRAPIPRPRLLPQPIRARPLVVVVVGLIWLHPPHLQATALLLADQLALCGLGGGSSGELGLSLRLDALPERLQLPHDEERREGRRARRRAATCTEKRRKIKRVR